VDTGELLHRALYALPDVTLAVERSSLRIVDVNRTGEAMGYAKPELTALDLAAFLDSPREELVQLVAAADGRLLESRARRKDRTCVRVSVRAAVSAAAAAQPCVLVVLRELPDERLTLEQYACLQAESEHAAEPMETINSRYGLSQPARVELDQLWRARIEHDPALWQEYSAALERYRKWFGVAGSAPRAESPAAEQTVTTPQLQAQAAVLPFKPAGVPDLTVEQYAALTVEIDANPVARREILSLHGIGSEVLWRKCEAHWTALLQADPSLRKRWMRLVTDFRAKLVRHAPNG
jgi:hypothetical protein